MELEKLLEATLAGLGFDLVDVEKSGRGKLLRVYIDKPVDKPVDKPGGITVEDCAAVSNHLTRLFAVENIDFERLEISSPGLDRPLKKLSDFQRFLGESAQIKLRMPLLMAGQSKGRKNFVGVMRSVQAGVLQLEVEGALVALELDNVDKARLVPKW